MINFPGLLRFWSYVYSYQTENSVDQNYLYNGKELQKELNIGWLDYGARMYQPELARFGAQDTFADKYLSISPYQYGGNNSIKYVDVNGDSIWIENGTLHITELFTMRREDMGQIYAVVGVSRRLVRWITNNPTHSDHRGGM
jgi:RHS repeat-associated protein